MTSITGEGYTNHFHKKIKIPHSPAGLTIMLTVTIVQRRVCVCALWIEAK